MSKDKHENIRSKFIPYLEKGEQIHFTYDKKKKGYRHFELSSYDEFDFDFVTFIISIFIPFLDDFNYPRAVVVVFGVFIWAFFPSIAPWLLALVVYYIVLWLIRIVRNYKPPKKKVVYTDFKIKPNKAKQFVITNQGLRIINLLGVQDELLYDKMYALKIDESGVLHLFGDIDAAISVIQLEAQSPKGLKNRIEKFWSEKSPYFNFDEILNDYAVKNKLAYQGFGNERKNVIQLKGEYSNSLQIQTDLNLKNKIASVEVKLVCENPENNYLHLRSEKTKDSIRKILGMQDYEIGQSWFDDDIIIQSNHEAFIQYILDDKTILKNLHAILSDSRASISMGESRGIEQSKKIEMTESQALDEHLIGESRKRIRKEGLQTELIFTNENWTKEKNLEVVAKEIIVFLEVMMDLAKRVNSYQ